MNNNNEMPINEPTTPELILLLQVIEIILRERRVTLRTSRAIQEQENSDSETEEELPPLTST